MKPGQSGEAFFERRSGHFERLQAGRIVDSRTTHSRGIALRTVGSDGSRSFIATSNLGPPLVTNPGEIVAQMHSLPCIDVHEDAGCKASGNERNERFERLQDRLLYAERAAYELGPELRHVMLIVNRQRRNVAIVTANGKRSLEVTTSCTVVAQCLAVTDQTGIGEYADSFAGDDRVEPQFIAGVAREAARRALVNVTAEPYSGGVVPVVFAAGAGGMLIHEAVGHGLEGDAIADATSIYAQSIGKRVAVAGLTILDDPTVSGQRGSFAQDDEGEDASVVQLVVDGVLEGFLNDSMSATRLRSRRAGNARRASFRHEPLPRMSNTIMLPGSDGSDDDIIGSVREGLFVVSLLSASVDISSGRFVFSVGEGYRISAGRVGAPVRNVTIHGVGQAALRAIRAVGSRSVFGSRSYFCEKAQQVLPVGIAVPTILVEGLTVGCGA